jgi:hypothetical protein
MNSSLPPDALEELQHFPHAKEKFLQAWKRGVAIAGPVWFGDGDSAGKDLQCIPDKWSLCPKVKEIRRKLRVMSGGKRMFLAAMVSFYDTHDGGALLKRCGFQGLADLSGLDLERRRVIADLLLQYEGW